LQLKFSFVIYFYGQQAGDGKDNGAKTKYAAGNGISAIREK